MKNVYSIYDTVMEEYSAPFLANNDNHAMMIFNQSIAKARESGFDHDFDLYFVGKFDMFSGVLSSSGSKKVTLKSSQLDQEVPDQKELF